MNRLQGSLLMLLLGVLPLCGCGSSASRELGRPTEVATWPAQVALMNPQLGMGIAYSLRDRNLAACRKAAASPELETALENFKKEPIPSQFATPAREAAKVAVIDAYSKLLTLGKSNGSLADLQKAYGEASQSTAKLVDPGLK